MMKRWGVPENFSIDPVGTAGALSAIAGVASIGWPYFDGMTAALGALATVGWLGRSLVHRSEWRRPLALAAIGATIAGWAFFLLADGPAGAVRGGILGASAGLVGWIGRRQLAFGEGP